MVLGAKGGKAGCGEGSYAEVLFEGKTEGVVASEVDQHVLVPWGEAEVRISLGVILMVQEDALRLDSR